MDKTQSQGEVDISLLELLVCPLTKTALRFDRENNELISEKAKLAYPVRDGVPIMLPSEARIIK
jgi:uncharacterized protein YbaR (Trm112 family)